MKIGYLWWEFGDDLDTPRMVREQPSYGRWVQIVYMEVVA